jgi:putative membrane protein
MHKTLDDRKRQDLDRRVAEAERITGAEIVLAVARRCDAYPELPWKAFALGAAVTGLAACVRDVLHPSWTSDAAVLLAIAATLAAGAACALLCVLLPRFARIFLDRHRAESEALQYAQSLFVSRNLASTKGRSGILLLVGLFERRVIVLPDAGIAARLDAEAIAGIAAAMTSAMKSSGVGGALEAGIARLEDALRPTKPAVAAEIDQLPNRLIEEDRP